MKLVIFFNVRMMSSLVELITTETLEILPSLSAKSPTMQCSRRISRSASAAVRLQCQKLDADLLL